MASRGIRKAVSERLFSAATPRNRASSNQPLSRQTAAGLPAKRWAVNALT